MLLDECQIERKNKVETFEWSIPNKLKLKHVIIDLFVGLREEEQRKMSFPDCWYKLNTPQFLEKSPLIKVKKESKKAGLKLNIQNTKIMSSGPNISQ